MIPLPNKVTTDWLIEHLSPLDMMSYALTKKIAGEDAARNMLAINWLDYQSCQVDPQLN